MRKVYLDHSATTPVHSEVVKIMADYMLQDFGNPSSIHSFGRTARQGMGVARKHLADLIGSAPEEIVFTSGGTEADNYAIKGVVQANSAKGKHIITTQFEHHAILHTCEHLEKEGFQVTYLPVDEDGLVRVEDVKAAIKDETVLISIMLANNEIGTIQPIKEISALAKENSIIFHTDAVQGVGVIPIDVNELGVDLLSLSGHKFYGPKGVGALYVRKGTKIEAISHGGSHERGCRAGTENIPGIVGIGKAAEIAKKEMDERMIRIGALRDKLMDGIMENIEDVRVNGHREKRLPGNVNVSISYIEGEALLLNLDMKGIAASSGSACTSGSLDPSHVLLAIGLPHEIAHGSLRMTLGAGTSPEDIDYVLKELPEIVSKLRAMSPLYEEALLRKERG